MNRIRDIEGVTQYLEGSSGKDVFVINSKANRYDWDLTQDGEGIVVWNKRTDNHDILYDFDKIRFSDTAVDITGSQEPAPVGSTLPNNPAPQSVPEVDAQPSPVPSETGIRIHDIAGTTQYLEGESGRDIFVIDGNSSEFDWDLTQDETGIVVWSHETHEHDILWDFEEMAFTDTTIDLIVA